MKLYELIQEIEKKYPRHLAESWDNVGLMLGDKNQEIKSILVSLEANEAVIDEAISLGVDLIVTHHPFYFSKMNQITSDTLKGRLTLKAIQNNISIYSAHTNYDIAFDGMNDAFIRSIGYEAEEHFLPAACEDWYLSNNNGKTPGLGRCFSLKEEKSLLEFCNELKETLGIDHLRYVGSSNRPIKKVAVITGSSADFYEDAKKAGADVLICGDTKYHLAQDILDAGMAVIDCGHFETENLFRESMADFLTSIPTIEVISSKTNLNPFNYA